MSLLTEERRSFAIDQLHSLGQDVCGPDCEGLVDLIQDSVDRQNRSTDPYPKTRDDFVGEGNQPAYCKAEAEAYEALKALLKAAKKAFGLATPPAVTKDFIGRQKEQPWLGDVDHFEAAVLRITNLPMAGITDGRVTSIVDAIRTLGTLAVPVAERPGVRPLFNSARIGVRASYYYRHVHNLDLEVNWDYLDRRGVKAGSRARTDELLPTTPTAKLACAVVELLDLHADRSEIKHHLQSYVEQLKEEGRAPGRADFYAEWV